MNNLTKMGLILQIPNVILLSILAIVFIIPYLTLSLIIWVILGTIYGLVNIASFIILIINGILNNGNY